MALSASELVRHPISKATAAFTAATAIFQLQALDIVASYLWVHIGEIFTIVSLAGFTIGPNVGFVPEDPLVIAAVLTGAAYGGKKLLEMGSELSEKLDS